MTPGDVVKRHQEVKRARLALQAEQAAELREYTEAEDALELWLLDFLVSNGLDNIKTSHGTAYKTSHVNTKLIDRQALIEYVKESGNYDIFTNALTKETVKTYLEVNKKAPPGVEITTATVVNVRKS